MRLISTISAGSFLHGRATKLPPRTPFAGGQGSLSFVEKHALPPASGEWAWVCDRGVTRHGPLGWDSLGPSSFPCGLLRTVPWSSSRLGVSKWGKRDPEMGRSRGVPSGLPFPPTLARPSEGSRSEDAALRPGEGRVGSAPQPGRCLDATGCPRSPNSPQPPTPQQGSNRRLRDSRTI